MAHPDAVWHHDDWVMHRMLSAKDCSNFGPTWYLHRNLLQLTLTGMFVNMPQGQATFTKSAEQIGIRGVKAELTDCMFWLASKKLCALHQEMAVKLCCEWTQVMAVVAENERQKWNVFQGKRVRK